MNEVLSQSFNGDQVKQQLHSKFKDNTTRTLPAHGRSHDDART